MRALRSAAALLRGAAGLTLASHHAASAGAGAQAAAELARRLGQGCATRHAATAAGDGAGRGPPRTKAPRVGKLGEKTADGKPKPDERTVADLVRRGWFKSEEAAVALLTRGKTNKHRYAFETAERAADWLEATLGPEPVKGGLCPAAKVVTGFPLLLTNGAAALQRKWDALTLPTERGGVGIELSTEQAREAVRKHPQLLNYSLETYKACWSMLTATEDGLGLSPEEAHKCILRSPAILMYDNNDFGRRVKLLESLGYAEARTMVLANPILLNYKDETVKESAAWWKQSGLDHLKIVTRYPSLLGRVPASLQAKLDFLRRVAGVSNEDLNNAGSLFALDLDGRLRTRYFYALQKGSVYRCSMSTLMLETDASYLAYALGRGNGRRKPASEAEVARYREEVASPEFVAWCKEQEARILQRTP